MEACHWRWFPPHRRRALQGAYTANGSPRKSTNTALPTIPSWIVTMDCRRPWSASSSFKFGDERVMICTKHGLLECQSLEHTALQAKGEDTSGSRKYPPNYFVPKLIFPVFSPNTTHLHLATSHDAFSFQYMHLQLESRDPATVDFQWVLLFLGGFVVPPHTCTCSWPLLMFRALRPATSKVPNEAGRTVRPSPGVPVHLV